MDQLNSRNFGVSVLPFLTTREQIMKAVDTYDRKTAAAATARIRELASLDAQIPALVDLYHAAISAPIAVRDEEAAATARFIEDFVPTWADRPWRELAHEQLSSPVNDWTQSQPIFMRLSVIWTKREARWLKSEHPLKSAARLLKVEEAALPRIAPKFLIDWCRAFRVRSRQPKGTQRQVTPNGFVW